MGKKKNNIKLRTPVRFTTLQTLSHRGRETIDCSNLKTFGAYRIAPKPPRSSKKKKNIIRKYLRLRVNSFNNNTDPVHASICICAVGTINTPILRAYIVVVTRAILT